MPEHNLILGDIRVLDLSEDVAGPFCTKLLAGLGAEVIKVEPPGTGDVTRRTGPFVHEAPHAEQSAAFLYLNTGKEHRSDISEPNRGFYIAAPGPGAMRVQSRFPAGYLDQLGLGYAALERLNPGLIYTSVTPFGQTGPYRDYKGLRTRRTGHGGIDTPLACPTRSRCGSVGMPLL